MATQLITIQAGRLQDMGARIAHEGRSVIRKRTEEALDEYGAILVVAIAQEAPQDTGVLRMSAKYSIKNRGSDNMTLSVSIGNGERPDVVVKSILFGHKDIYPKKPNGWLHWVDKTGKDVFSKHVKPTSPDDFLGRAWDRTASQRRSMTARIGRLIVAEIQAGKGAGVA